MDKRKLLSFLGRTVGIVTVVFALQSVGLDFSFWESLFFIVGLNVFVDSAIWEKSK